MKALQMKHYGGRDVLEFTRNAPKPAVGKNQVLIEVQGARRKESRSHNRH